ncbi:MAG TPA: hypothetical protein VKH37_08775, partial [Ferruginibacter sp.]|nr:hypothetical protein [Ferruginibacter sp.]
MRTRSQKQFKRKGNAVANDVVQQQTNDIHLSKADPNSAVDANQIRAAINDSPQVSQFRSCQAMANEFVGQKNNGTDKATVQNTNKSTVQRKIVVNNRPFIPGDKAEGELKEASGDEFVRHYKSEDEMNAHLVTKSPVSVGLIKPLALWYNLPVEPNEFFVFGESHHGVNGEKLKAASNIKKPILDEKITGWNVPKADKDDEEDDEEVKDNGNKDQGLDENSSKLMRAIEVWTPTPPKPKVVAVDSDDSEDDEKDKAPKLPDIPEGEESTRDAEHGSYKLIVRGENKKSKLWSPVKKEKEKDEEPQLTKYDAQGPAFGAIKELFPIVFADEIQRKTLDAFHGKLAR